MLASERERRQARSEVRRRVLDVVVGHAEEAEGNMPATVAKAVRVGFHSIPDLRWT